MNSELPKQFLPLNKKPILLHTLERFHHSYPDAQLLITLPTQWRSYWSELVDKFRCTIAHQLIFGGEERYFSVKNALEYASGEVVGVHDGVRPFVSSETIRNCVESAYKYGSGVPFLPIYESLRQKKNAKTVGIDRTQIIRMQTPQCFLTSILKKAYKLPYNDQITDEARLVELAGFDIHIVPGNEENIKITTPIDYRIANLFV